MVSSKSSVEEFYDPDTQKYTGFAGTVRLYKQDLYVDTRDGTGYDKVIAGLEKYITNLAYKYNLSSLGFTLEDTKQHIILRILEGIPSYDPSKNTTLSTFLYMRIERRIINEVRNVSTDSKNPTILRTSLHSVSCDCGRKFMIGTSSDESIEDKQCYKCGRPIKNAKIFSVNIPPANLSSYLENKKWNLGDESVVVIDDIVSNESIDISLVYGVKSKLDDSVILKRDVEKGIEREDEQVRGLVGLICFNDYTVKAAAEAMGISHTGASNKLKNLKRKKIIRDMLGR